MFAPAEKRFAQPVHRARAHARLETRAKVHAQPVRLLMNQGCRQSFS
jgi:hypothetical protein